jgi:hypothetical protein
LRTKSGRSRAFPASDFRPLSNPRASLRADTDQRRPHGDQHAPRPDGRRRNILDRQLAVAVILDDLFHWAVSATGKVEMPFKAAIPSIPGPARRYGQPATGHR